MYLEFKKLESDPKKGHIIQFSLEEVHTVSSRNFIAIKRPLLNIDSIERSIRSNYREQIEKGLFSDVVAKQCDEEIKNAIETERQRILALPHPIILDGVVKEAKYIDGGATIKMLVSLPDAEYILENIKDMQEMEAELLEFPSYLSGELQKQKIESIVQEFLDNNPFSIVHYNQKRYKNIKIKDRKNEVLEKPREADKAIKVSLHDISLNEQKIEDDPKYKHKKRKSWK